MPGTSMIMQARGANEEFSATPGMREIFSDRGRVQAMLDFEAALTRAEADVGIISAEFATIIAAQCRAKLFDLDRLAEGSALTGNTAIPLVTALTDLVTRKNPAAARFVHWGATSQDAMDTGLVLQLKSALDLFDVNLGRLSEVLAELVRSHRRSVQLGRADLQSAPPVTFGMKAAGWLSSTVRARERLRDLRARALVLELGGVGGTLASLGPKGLEVATRTAKALGLTLPALPWHAQRDRLAEVATALALLAGSLGKMGRDVALMMQPEVRELSVAEATPRALSAATASERSPLYTASIVSAAARVPGLVATLLASLPQEHERGLGGWQTEAEVLPEICLLTSGAVTNATLLFEALRVDPDRMRSIVHATSDAILGEVLRFALFRRIGPEADALFERAWRRMTHSDLSLRAVLETEQEATKRLTAAELKELCNPTTHLGFAEEWCDRTLAEHAKQAGRAPASNGSTTKA